MSGGTESDVAEMTGMASPVVQMTPPASPPSPSASFYDLSDDEEGEYSTIMHSKSGRGVKLLFSKSKVRFAGSATSLDQAPANKLRFTYIPHPLRKTIHLASSLWSNRNPPVRYRRSVRPRLPQFEASKLGRFSSLGYQSLLWGMHTTLMQK